MNGHSFGSGYGFVELFFQVIKILVHLMTNGRQSIIVLTHSLSIPEVLGLILNPGLELFASG